MISLIDIRTLSLEQLEEAFINLGEKKFRAQQVYEWLWKKYTLEFEKMTNLSKELRQKLNESFIIRPILLDKFQKSNDGTIKCRFKLHDGHFIESVLIPVPHEHRYTVCVSTQVGCSLTCTFCATGRMGRIRNLDYSEIYDQVAQVNELCLENYNHTISNIVYMGMGEPLLNYQNTLKSIHYITHENGMGMSPKRITVSTAGIAKLIKKLADDSVKFNLALSLHAANDVKRNEIMPINEQNTLDILVDALQYFDQNTKNNITFEYICFQDFNDSISDAIELVRICKLIPAKVNILEYNPIDNAPFDKSSEHRINDFAKYLSDHKINVTVRRSRGRDIDAACGQLANKN